MTSKSDSLDLRAQVHRSEFQQTRLRLGVAGTIAAYATVHAALSGSSDGNTLLFAWAYFVGAILISLSTLAWPGPSISRRIVGILIDVSAATWALWLMGEAGVMLVGIYLFIILGNGIRYGRKYLRITQVLSIIGFASVMSFAPWWHEHLLIGAGFLLSLLIIPFYFSVLVSRVVDAKVAAERTLEERLSVLARLVDAKVAAERALAECRGRVTSAEQSSGATES
jgi:two-component system, sensor histidine kinase RpfC